MKTSAATLLVNRSGSARLEIRSHRVFVEVVHSDCKMVDFARRIARSKHQKILPKRELVVPLAFVYCAAECALIKSVDRCRLLT